MAKAVKKQASKKRASTYDPKLAVSGTFEELIKVSVSNIPIKSTDATTKPKKKII